MKKTPLPSVHSSSRHPTHHSMIRSRRKMKNFRRWQRPSKPSKNSLFAVTKTLTPLTKPPKSLVLSLLNPHHKKQTLKNPTSTKAPAQTMPFIVAPLNTLRVLALIMRATNSIPSLSPTTKPSSCATTVVTLTTTTANLPSSKTASNNPLPALLLASASVLR